MDGTAQHRPAHQTKSEKILTYSGYSLHQSDDGATNGTTLWLGGQILSAYLPTLKLKRRPGKAIELGSGIGLSACDVSTPSASLCSADALSDSLSLHLAGMSWQQTCQTSLTRSSVKILTITSTLSLARYRLENLTGWWDLTSGPGPTRNPCLRLLSPRTHPLGIPSDRLSS